MANKDDLSVNINVGVNLDKASVDEANAAIDGLRENLDDLLASRSKGAQKDFLTEIKKQLGFGADVDLQVGGYSIKEPLKKARQKAGRGYEKIAGGAFDGAALADKAETAIARSLNEAGKELAKRFNVSFVDDFAESMKDISFKKNTKSEISAAQEYINKSVDPKDAQKISQMLGLQASNVLSTAISKSDFQIPGDENSLAQLSQQIENGVEDFVVNALGSVTISPAMFIAAADRAMQNTPDVRANSETGSYSAGWFDKFKEPGKVMEPRGAFPKAKPFPISTEDEIARFDKVAERTIGKIGADKFSKALSYAISKDFDEIILGNWEKIAEEIANSKDIQKILKDDPTFNLSGIGADDAMANLERYRQERFIESVREDEVARGYAPNSFASSLSKGQFPYQLQSAKYGTTFDELPADSMDILPKDVVKRWLSTMVEDGIKAPLIQALENPAIFGKGFISKSESTIQSQFTRLSNQASGVESLSPKQKQEKIYHDQLMAQGKELGNLAQWLSKRVTDVTAGDISKLQKGNLPQVDARGELKPQAQDFAVDFFNAMRGGEFEQFKGELKSNLQDYEAEQNRLKDIKRFGPIAGAGPVRGGALDPNLDLLREFLIGLKNDGGRPVAAMDTEYFTTTKDSVTELGIIINDGKGKLTELFKFLQVPTDLQGMENAWQTLSKNPKTAGLARTQAKDFNALAQRADTLGIPRSRIGSATDSAKNAEIANRNYKNLVAILDLFAELDIPLTGSSMKGAEVNHINDSIAYINKLSADLKLSPIGTPNLNRLIDPGSNPLKGQLADPKISGPTVSAAFASSEKEISGSVNTLMNYIAKEHGQWLKQFEPKFAVRKKGKSEDYIFDYQATGGSGKAGPHTAMADAAASAIIYQFLKEFSTGRGAMFLVPAVKNAVAELENRASGGGKGGGGGGPTKSGDMPDDGGLEKRSSEALQRIYSMGREYENLFLGLTKNEKVTLEQKLQTLSQEGDRVALAAKILDKEQALAALQREALEIKRGLSEKELKFAQSLAVTAGVPVRGKDFQQRPDWQVDARPIGPMQGPMASAESQRYVDQLRQVVQLKDAIVDLTQKGVEKEKQARSDLLTSTRGKDVSEQLTQNLRKQLDANIANTQAGKTATNSIKAQMQEQVNAQKAVQRQTQSLMNTWVTSRYALYDVGNFYQNVAQNLIRVSRQIFDTTQSYRRFETAFTSVERAMQLTGAAATDMRDQFVLLSETIPVAFEDIARIGTLGAQMGIASDGIIGFTETVAKFSAITNIAAETVAQQFGRIAELADVDPTQFNNLGSAVAFAGVNAVATEAEILNLTQSIAAVSNQSGMTAPEIVGIATALASVGIQAEQARGVFTRVFADIDRAAQGGGESLKALADVTGLSAKEISGSWGKDGAANEVFIALLEGLNSADNLTAAFDKLNIVETREINTLTRLAKNLDVVQQALSDSNVSFEDAAFLGESFERTADNLDSKITLLKNNFDSLAAALSGSFANLIGSPFEIAGIKFDALIDTASNFLKILKGLEKSLLFTTVLPITATLIAGTAAFAAYRAVVAKTQAQVLAFRVAVVNSANDSSVVEGPIRQLKSLLGLGSGLIEMRDQVSGANEKGLIEPVNYKNIFGDLKSQQKELLESRNIYLSLGEVAKNSLSEEKAASMSKIQLARTEADAVNNLIAARKLEIETLELSQNPADIAKAASMRAAGSQLHVFAIEGEIVALNKLELEEYQAYVMSSNMTEAKKREALARAQNATVINQETKAAAGGFSTVMGKVGSLMGIIGIAAVVVPAILAIGDAIANIGKIDILEAGGGLESLREAIKTDTQAVQDGAMKAVATAKVQYIEYGSATDTAAMRLRKFTGLSDEAATSIKKVTKTVKEQTIAVGENTKEWIANALYKALENQDIDFTNIQKTMAELGMTFDQVIADMTAAANGANINPLAALESRMSQIENSPALKGLDIEMLSNPQNDWMLNLHDERVKALALEYRELVNLEKVLNGVGDGFQKAFSKTSTWTAIKEALGIDDADNAITKLIDRYSKALKDGGKGMKKVFADVKTAVLEMLPADLKEKLEIKVKKADSIDSIIAIMQAEIKLEKQIYKRNLQLWRGVNLLRLQAGLAPLAMPEAPNTADAEAIIAALNALKIGGDAAVDALDKVGGAAESAADKLARLLSEANAGVQKVLDLRSAFRSLGKSMAESKDFSFDTDLGAANISSVLSVIESIGNRAGGNFKQAERNLNIFKLTLQDMGAPQRAIDLINKAIGKLGGSTNLTKKQAAELRLQFAAIFNTFKTNFQTGANEIDNVEKKIRTLTDFVSDLRGVLQSAFEVRYGAQTGLDAITTSWFNLTKAAEDAQKAVKSANDEINQSMADKTVLQYQLSVAQRYNDEKRSAVIRAKLAKLDQQIVDQQQQLADANSANDKSLTGNTKSAVDNRAKVRDLVTQYNSYLLSLANTNMSSTDLAAKAKELEADFLAQGLALGYAETELKTYTQAFAGDFTKVLAGVPRDITVTVNTDPALRAIQEFVAKAQTELAKIGTGSTAPVAPLTPVVAVGTINGNTIWDGTKWVSRAASNRAVGSAGPNNPGTTIGQIGPQGNYIWDGRYWLKRAKGGMISGPGGSMGDRIPTLLSSGEFVVRAGAVKTYGPDFMNALNQQKVSFAPTQGSFNGGSSGGSQMVYLSPEDRALLRAAVDRPIALYTENSKIAQSANAGNVLLAQRGTN